jgi:hypothetical protein
MYNVTRNVQFHIIGAFAKLQKKRLLASSYSYVSVCLSVCLCVRMEHLGSHWTDFNELWYLSIFLKIYQRFTAGGLKLEHHSNSLLILNPLYTLSTISCWSGYDADNPPPSSGEVMKELSYTSTPPLGPCGLLQGETLPYLTISRTRLPLLCRKNLK